MKGVESKTLWHFLLNHHIAVPGATLLDNVEFGVLHCTISFGVDTGVRSPTLTRYLCQIPANSELPDPNLFMRRSDSLRFRHSMPL
jgi:hypothetical protein